MTSCAPRTACYDWAKTFSLHPRRRRQRPCLTAEPVVIDYETFCKIHDCHDRQRLTITQTARALGLHPRERARCRGSDEQALCGTYYGTAWQEVFVEQEHRVSVSPGVRVCPETSG